MEAPATISTSASATLSTVAVMTAIDDGDDDLIVTSEPKSGDSLNVFVADFGNAGSNDIGQLLEKNTLSTRVLAS